MEKARQIWKVPSRLPRLAGKGALSQMALKDFHVDLEIPSRLLPPTGTGRSDGTTESA
jgi:hypothetical protein